jgi:hypothetical protein
MAVASDWLVTVASFFAPEQAATVRARDVDLSLAGDDVLLAVKALDPGKLAQIAEGAERVPPAAGLPEDPAAAQSVVEDARGYGDDELSAADMNNLACALVWAAQNRGQAEQQAARAAALRWLEKAAAQATDEAAQAAIGANVALLKDPPAPLPVPIGVFLKMLKLGDVASSPLAGLLGAGRGGPAR